MFRGVPAGSAFRRFPEEVSQGQGRFVGDGVHFDFVDLLDDFEVVQEVPAPRGVCGFLREDSDGVEDLTGVEVEVSQLLPDGGRVARFDVELHTLQALCDLYAVIGRVQLFDRMEQAVGHVKGCPFPRFGRGLQLNILQSVMGLVSCLRCRVGRVERLV